MHLPVLSSCDTSETLTIQKQELLQAEIWNQVIISGKTLLSVLNLIS